MALLMTEFTEDRIPSQGIETTIDDLVELYGGESQASNAGERRFILPLRRGVPVAGGVECRVSWTVTEAGEATVTLVCDREVDAPKWQRAALLIVGVIGALAFTIWPFFGKNATKLGTVAVIGAFLAIAVYFLTLKRSAGGIAYDFLQRLARHQREATADQ
jgi:hypothetical protein